MPWGGNVGRAEEEKRGGNTYYPAIYLSFSGLGTSSYFVKVPYIHLAPLQFIAYAYKEHAIQQIGHTLG